MNQNRTPRLPEAVEMEGVWSLGPANGPLCEVRLTMEEVALTGPDAAAWRLKDQGDCLSQLDLQVIAAWRPSSEGVSLLRADGSLVVFLARRGQGYEGKGPGDRLLRLTRP